MQEFAHKLTAKTNTSGIGNMDPLCRLVGPP
jgi:hypothetical protein